MARPWRSAYDSPRLFCGCGITSTRKPGNDFRHIVPASGQNYAGYHVYYSRVEGRPDDDHPQRDIISVKLCDSLSIGVRYYASFKIILATNGQPTPFSHHGMKLTTKSLVYGPLGAGSTTNSIISNFAHVYSDKPVGDSIGWTTIKGSFIADSNYKYAYVGILFQSSVAAVGQPKELISRGAYYYIDDVCLSTDSLSFQKTPPPLCTPLPDKPSMRQIYDNDFCRNTFYSWTTEEQINDLRKTRTLLTKSKSDKGEYSIYDVSLRDPTLRNDDFIQVLLEERFAKKRYAWANSFATVMGWEEENYGHHLLKIVLRDSAIIGRFKRIYEKEVLGFYDLKGRKLSNDYVLKHTNRIAAIYHINSFKGSREQFHQKKVRRTSMEYTSKHSNESTNIHFREFVIVNEDMILNWSYGTEEIKEEIRYEIALLKNLKRSKDAKEYAYYHSQGDWRLASEYYIPEVFSDPKKDREALENGEPVDSWTYFNLQSFQNDYYLFNPKAIQKIIDALESALKEQSTALTK